MGLRCHELTGPRRPAVAKRGDALQRVLLHWLMDSEAYGRARIAGWPARSCSALPGNQVRKCTDDRTWRCAVPESTHAGGEHCGFSSMLEQKRESDARVIQDAIHGGADLGAVREHFRDTMPADIITERGRVDVSFVDELRRATRPAVWKALPCHRTPP